MLRALYLPEWKVHGLANCRKGVWRAAAMLNTALTKRIIVDRLGYPSMSAHYLNVRENLLNRLGTERYARECGRGTNHPPI